MFHVHLSLFIILVGFSCKRNLTPGKHVFFNTVPWIIPYTVNAQFIIAKILLIISLKTDFYISLPP